MQGKGAAGCTPHDSMVAGAAGVQKFTHTLSVSLIYSYST